MGLHFPPHNLCPAMMRAVAAAARRVPMVVRSLALPSRSAPQVRALATHAAMRSAASSPAQPSTAVAPAAVRYWLYGCSATVFGMIVLGGVTRLTESGLSMTHWSLAGEHLPRNAAEWDAEFERYKDSPEYELLNRGMSVDEFKRIFMYEYSHRMLGRFIGVAFALPLGYFWLRGRLTPQLKRNLSLILVALGGQGLLGWYMVKSGLKGHYDPSKGAPPRVSQYRLAAHLSSALVIYSAMLWNALALTGAPTSVAAATSVGAKALGKLRFAGLGVLGLVATTIVSGAFVAGLDAGLIYNEFPMMGTSLVPEGYLRDGLRSIFEHDATVQFDHRVLALASTMWIGHLWGITRKMPLPPTLRLAVRVLTGVVAVQVTLGITTLLMFVPVHLGASHQAGSVALLSSVLWLLHETRKLQRVLPK
eukprot:Amastigsp_a510144_50.p1 type:complete len:420 gc:universal Amastigsp_a510144_50:1-1260(+)